MLFQFYAKNDGLRLTDLHQGIVWGTNTPQTILDERLINRFDYDGDYGTVLNRCGAPSLAPSGAEKVSSGKGNIFALRM